MCLPSQTCDDGVVAENDLDDFCRVPGEDPERVVPESASQNESAVNGHHETRLPHLDSLTAKRYEMLTTCFSNHVTLSSYLKLSPKCLLA